jgi:hypothetical protein
MGRLSFEGTALFFAVISLSFLKKKFDPKKKPTHPLPSFFHVKRGRFADFFLAEEDLISKTAWFTICLFTALRAILILILLFLLPHIILAVGLGHPI